MPLVSLSGVSVSFGERRLLDAVNLTVSSGSRMALVGPNGSGKTTLMRIMAGQVSADAGSVVSEKETRVSYVPQSGAAHSGCTLFQEAEKAFDREARLVEEMRALEEELGRLAPGEAAADGLIWKHHHLQEALGSSGYYSRAEAVQRVLTGLGFRGEDRERECSTFSAGWQMRIALARAILERPDILLLDEPTNYLDIEARAWLSGFLADFSGGLLLVSHDRWFLDAVVTSVAEIFMARVSVFTGNYSHYEEARSRELAAIRSAGVPSRRRSPGQSLSSRSSATTPPRRASCRAGSPPWRRWSASRSLLSSRPSIFPFRLLLTPARLSCRPHSLPSHTGTSLSSAVWAWRYPAGRSSSLSG